MDGSKLKQLRKAKKITLSEAAQAIDVAMRTYTSYEREERDPSLDVLCKLADFYGVTTDYLLGREPDSESNELLVQYNSLEDKQKRLVKAYLSLSGEIRSELFDTLKDLIISAEKE